MYSLPACRLIRAAFASFILLFTFTTAGYANGQNVWTVFESHGAVHITMDGLRPVALTSGDVLEPGQRITTGENGRAVLQMDQNTIVVSPNSALDVPKDRSSSLMTRVRHIVGTLLFDVEKRDKQHFEVLTPDVAVVVKGTTFTTSVGSEGAVVHVISGLVQVADVRSGQAVFVRPGQTAVSPKGGGSLNVQGAKTPGTKQNGNAKAGDTANASDSPSDKSVASDNAASGQKAKNATSGKGVKIARNITGQTQSIGQLTGGLLRNDGQPGQANGKAKKGGFSDIPGAALPSQSLGLTSVNGPPAGFTPPGQSVSASNGNNGNGNAYGKN